MRIASLAFTAFASLIILPAAQGFIAPTLTRCPPSAHQTSRPGSRHASSATAVSQNQPRPWKPSPHPSGRLFRPHPAGGVFGRDGLREGRPLAPCAWSAPGVGSGLLAMSAAGEGVRDGGEGAAGAQGEGRADGAAAPPPPPPPPPATRKAVEPVGAAGAVEDEILMELVGQDYGMMALLRNDKFRGLIVLLRNIPPNEWVTEVAKAYPDDDEVKGMLGQVGKLMRMIDYYQAKKPRK